MLEKLEFCIKGGTYFQIIFDNDVSDGIKHEFNVVGVGGAGQMSVDLFLVFSFIEILEFHPNVAARLLVRVGALKFKDNH